MIQKKIFFGKGTKEKSKNCCIVLCIQQQLRIVRISFCEEFKVFSPNEMPVKVKVCQMMPTVGIYYS